MSSLEIAFTQEYQRALLKLTPVQQAQVNRAILKLQKGLDAPHLHKLESLPFHAFGVNQNALRIICKRDQGLLIILHVGAHDEAYRWASRHVVKQIGSYVRLIRTTTEIAAQVATPSAAVKEPEGPLASVPDKTFRHFHLALPVVEILRKVANETALLELLSCFQQPLASALLGLYTDPEDLGQIVRDFKAARQAEEAQAATQTVSLRDAIQAPVNSAAFWLAPTDSALLEQVLSRPLEAWRVFLHPSQKRLVTMHAKGAYKVTGGPGTGKSIVALHRTRYLLEKAFAGQSGKILLTTFSRVLAGELRRSMELLCIDRPELLARIEVKTVTRVAQDLLSDGDKPYSFLGDDVIDACWQQAMRLEGLGRDEGFYRAEREHVVARSGAWTGTQYLRAPRSGRGSRLDRVSRRKVWRVIEAFEQALAERGGGDGARLARTATELITTGQIISPYLAVVCDEHQDVSASDLRLMAALTRDLNSGQTRPNSLFLVGDRYQSLYRSPVVLSRCGIEIRGRSCILRRNYRTTEGIRRAAIDVVRGVRFDDGDDGSEDSSAVLDNYTSLRGGPPPTRQRFESPEAEADWIAEQAGKDAGWPLLVLTRTNRWMDELYDRLRVRGVAPKRLDAHESLSSEDQVVLCSLHRSKGLEAPRVIIAGAQFIPRPWHGRGDPGDKLIWERQERCLLYVGMTRARDWCALTRVGDAS